MAGNSSVLLGEGGERTWMLGVGEETLSLLSSMMKLLCSNSLLKFEFLLVLVDRITL